MKITLISKSVAHASIEALAKTDEKKRTKINVSLGNQIYENQKKPNVFRIAYTSSIKIEGVAQIEIAYNFDFEGEGDFTPELVETDVIKMQAPALAYPYIKSYVEALISMSGLGSFNLPYLDFYENPFEYKSVSE